MPVSAALEGQGRTIARQERRALGYPAESKGRLCALLEPEPGIWVYLVTYCVTCLCLHGFGQGIVLHSVVLSNVATDY